MINPQEIAKGIGAHGMWKQSVLAAIEKGKSDVTPEQAGKDNVCDFGRWLYGLAPMDQKSDHFKKVQTLHAAFHKEASHILHLALVGQKAAVEKSLASDGAYTKISADLTSAMMAWKRAIEG